MVVRAKTEESQLAEAPPWGTCCLLDALLDFHQENGVPSAARAAPREAASEVDNKMLAAPISKDKVASLPRDCSNF